MDPTCSASSASTSSDSSNDSTGPKEFTEMHPASLPSLDASSASPLPGITYFHSLQTPMGQLPPLSHVLPPLNSISFNGLLYPQPRFALPAPSFMEYPQAMTAETVAQTPVMKTEEDKTVIQKMESIPAPIVNLENLAPIAVDSRYKTFAEFEAVFRNWRENGFHPFRIASSESLKEPNGKINLTFRYRYVVFHCAHYGEPRLRGNGKRPNQNYLPCGCHCMLRLNFNFNEHCLRITTLVTKHTGHPNTKEHYQAVISKLKAVKRRRTSDSFSSLSDPLRISPSSSLVASTSNSSQTSSQVSTAQNSPIQSMGHINTDIMRQQLFHTLLKQQHDKMAQESSNAAQGNQQSNGVLTTQNLSSSSFQAFTAPKVDFRHCFSVVSSSQISPAMSQDENEPSAKRVKLEATAENLQISMPVASAQLVAQQVTLPPVTNYSSSEDTENLVKDIVIDVPALPGLPKIAEKATFKTFAEFESAFEHWKDVGMHPFRVASSETMKELDGTVNHVMRYRYVVFHCAHYGEPRMRGAGLRPNQSYLPCGCGAMLRLNYSFPDQALKITLVAHHKGHPRDREYFEKILSKLRAGKSHRRHSEMPAKPVASVRATRRVSEITRPAVHSDSESSRASRGSGSPPSMSHEEKPMMMQNMQIPTLPVLNAQNLFLQQQLFSMIMLNQQKAALSMLSQVQQPEPILRPELAGLPRPIAKHSTPFLDMLNLPQFTATGISSLPIPSITAAANPNGSEQELKRIQDL